MQTHTAYKLDESNNYNEGLKYSETSNYSSNLVESIKDRISNIVESIKDKISNVVVSIKDKTSNVIEVKNKRLSGLEFQKEYSKGDKITYRNNQKQVSYNGYINSINPETGKVCLTCSNKDGKKFPVTGCFSNMSEQIIKNNGKIDTPEEEPLVSIKKQYDNYSAPEIKDTNNIYKPDSRISQDISDMMKRRDKPKKNIPICKGISKGDESNNYNGGLKYSETSNYSSNVVEPIKDKISNVIEFKNKRLSGLEFQKEYSKGDKIIYRNNQKQVFYNGYINSINPETGKVRLTCSNKDGKKFPVTGGFSNMSEQIIKNNGKIDTPEEEPLVSIKKQYDNYSAPEIKDTNNIYKTDSRISQDISDMMKRRDKPGKKIPIFKGISKKEVAIFAKNPEGYYNQISGIVEEFEKIQSDISNGGYIFPKPQFATKPIINLYDEINLLYEGKEKASNMNTFYSNYIGFLNVRIDYFKTEMIQQIGNMIVFKSNIEKIKSQQEKSATILDIQSQIKKKRGRNSVFSNEEDLMKTG